MTPPPRRRLRRAWKFLIVGVAFCFFLVGEGKDAGFVCGAATTWLGSTAALALWEWFDLGKFFE